MNNDFKRFMSPDFQAAPPPEIQFAPMEQDQTAGNMSSITDQLKQYQAAKPANMGAHGAMDAAAPMHGMAAKPEGLMGKLAGGKGSL